MKLGITPATPEVAGNYINYSRLFEYTGPLKTAMDISLKYVYNGQETYDVDKSVYDVKKGSFLLINMESKYAELLEGNQLNEGLCVHLTADLLKKCYYDNCQSDDRLLSYPDESWNADLEFVEGLYNDKLSPLLQYLQELGRVASQTCCIAGFNEEHYHQLANYLVQEQRVLSHQIGKIKAKTPAVQKELFRRVQTVKRYIDENFYLPLNISDLAPVAQMSTFHFMRTFKQTYKLSPYQYIMQSRLDQSLQLLKGQQINVTEVAHLSGFCDLYSFSKAFKKRFGASPINIFKVEKGGSN